MAGGGDCIAVDWGTSNRRAFRLDANGSVVDVQRDGLGVLAVPAGHFAAEFDALTDCLGATEVIAAGMVGSSRGWVEVPYHTVPAGLDDLATALGTPRSGVRIVPGVSLAADGRYDVMRGEEMQVLGAIAAGLAPADAWFCQPGTHNKWVRTRAGRIVDFATAMTGELFALIKAGGILAGMLDGPVSDDDAFRAGVDRGAHGCDLPVALFEVRAKVLLGAIGMEEAAAHASGILIGADVGGRRHLPSENVYLIGSGPLVTLYAAAIGRLGGRTVHVDGEAAFVAGIHALRSLIR